MAHHLLSASTITGDSVRNRKGEELGNIKDLMVDVGSGQIEYAVLSFGGILGLGDKYFAIPFDRFEVDRANECMILNVAEDRLKAAPGFDKDRWPDFADPSFRDTIKSHYVTG